MRESHHYCYSCGEFSLESDTTGRIFKQCAYMSKYDRSFIMKGELLSGLREVWEVPLAILSCLGFQFSSSSSVCDAA